MFPRSSWVEAGVTACLLGACVGGGSSPKDPYDLGGSGKGGAASSVNAPQDGGTDTGIGAAKASGSRDSHMPLVDGATFTYHHDKSTKKAPWDEVATLRATTYMGKPAFFLEDQEDAQGEQSQSTLQVQGTQVFRVFKTIKAGGQKALEVSYDPGFLRYDEAWTSAGQKMTLVDDWKQVCFISTAAQTCSVGVTTPGATSHTFEVLATDAEITVPAGTFHAVQVQRVNGKGETKQFWFVSGIGKLRELDVMTGAVEDLLRVPHPVKIQALSIASLSVVLTVVAPWAVRAQQVPSAATASAATAEPAQPAPVVTAPAEPPPAPAPPAIVTTPVAPPASAAPALPAPAPPSAATAETAPAVANGDPWGDDAGGVHEGVFSLRMLIQARYGQTFAADSNNTLAGYALREQTLVHDNDGWRLQRLFLRIGADPMPELSFKALLDFAKLRSNVDNVLKQAYATARPWPRRLEITAGLFKLPLGILELDPTAHFELASPGVVDVLSSNLGYAGSDLGAQIMVAPLHKAKRLRFFVGAFRGNSKDENASPVGAMGARVEARPWKALRLGADVVGMPQATLYKRAFETSSKEVLPNPPDPLYPRQRSYAAGKAYSVDITFERKRFMLRGEGMLGDRIDVDTRYGARTFMAAWALAAYRFHTGPVDLMPAARIAWLDADREHKVGVRRELTLALNLIFSEQLRLLLDVTNTAVEPGSAALDQPLPLPAYPYFDLNHTTVIAQLQATL